MAQIQLAPEVSDDFERILDHLAQHGAENTAARLRGIIHAIDVLATNPLIGRLAADNSNRELIIGRRAQGYVALYRYLPEIDTVFVLALRNQREAGYKREK